MIKSPNWLSKILKEETVTSTNDRTCRTLSGKKNTRNSPRLWQNIKPPEKGQAWEFMGIRIWQEI